MRPPHIAARSPLVAVFRIHGYSALHGETDALRSVSKGCPSHERYQSLRTPVTAAARVPVTIIASTSAPTLPTSRASPTVLEKSQSDLAEQLVPGVPAKNLIDRFELLEVRQHHTQVAIADSRVIHVVTEPVQKERAVCKPGKRIVVGEVIQLVRFVDVIQGERDIPASSSSRRISASSNDALPSDTMTRQPTALSATSKGSTTRPPCMPSLV